MLRADLPFGLHGQLTLYNLDQILVVYSSISFFEQEYLFIGSAQKDLVEDVFVCPSTFAGSIQKVQITSERSKSKEHKGVFEPETVSGIIFRGGVAAFFLEWVLTKKTILFLGSFADSFR